MFIIDRKDRVNFNMMRVNRVFFSIVSVKWNIHKKKV